MYLLNSFVGQLVHLRAVRSIKTLTVKMNIVYTILSSFRLLLYIMYIIVYRGGRVSHKLGVLKHVYCLEP